MNLIEYADFEALAIDLAQTLADGLKAALKHRKRATICLPGGSTPGPVFDDLCAVDLDWGRVDVVLSDERWVPENSPRSNTRLLRQRLLVNRAAAATLIPLYKDANAPEDVLDDLARGLAPCLPIDILLLGMGEDMHTASLFPGADQLAQAFGAQAPLMLAMRAPGAPEPRVTLSAPVLLGAMSTHVLIRGAGKRAALTRAQKISDPLVAPISAFLHDANVHWAP